MKLNADKPHLWKADVERSIDFYNDWFLRFAPTTYRTQRKVRTKEVREAFDLTDNLRTITPECLMENPGVLPMLRMITAPPIARDRLMGLSRTGRNLIKSMEGNDERLCRIPPKMRRNEIYEALSRICDIILELTDHELFPWLDGKHQPGAEELERAAMVVADRLCGAASDPIIRNAQERRQLQSLKKWLTARGYSEVRPDSVKTYGDLAPMTFAFRLNIPVGKGDNKTIIPVDCAIQPRNAGKGDVPILIEAKSAGDATNTNKRRKEEAQKYSQLKANFGEGVKYILLLCGYFEAGYLGYEASEGIDWVWEHRIGDLEPLLGGRLQKKSPESVREEVVDYKTDYSLTEKTRFEQQRIIDQRKTAEERNKRGQFSTPFGLAEEIVRSSIKHLPEFAPVRFMEPAVGTGVFFSALLKSMNGRKLEEAVGIEIDSAYAEVAQRLWFGNKLTVIVSDFLDFACLPENEGRFNLLCTNPPYVRHHHMEPAEKRKLQDEVFRRRGLTVSGLSGLYVYFVLLSHNILSDNAVASWLIPSEFLYVNYGKALRDYLLHHVTLLDIHQFDPEDVQFDDALVSSCVITYRKNRPSGDSSISYSFGGTMANPHVEKTIEAVELDSSNKWIFRSGRLGGNGGEHALRLGHLFDIKRGLATGANSFFILTEENAREYGIPPEFLRPILPSPRFLKDAVISADEAGLPNIERRLFLLDCPEPPETVKERYPGLWAYLETGRERGIVDTYLCSNRKVWYFQERREPALFLATYMGRSEGEKRCPLHFYLNFSKAVVTNVFLNLYPKPFLLKLLNGSYDRTLELLRSLQAITCAQMVDGGRSYGGGLHKLEPREMGNVVLRSVPAWLVVEFEEQLVLI
ncbi:MAG: XamI family restriction endonuclease [Nitrospirae bacterium]|nr:XamI family restriction endonuclease [Nitrospirota bacterium]